VWPGCTGRVADSTLSTRPSAALALLRDAAGYAAPPGRRWSWAVVRVDSAGRVGLPPAARQMLGAGTAGVTAKAVSRGPVLVVRPGAVGAPITVDRRGRLSVPVWWRRMCVPAGAVAVATRSGDGPLVVVAPTGVLDGLADVLVGERR
jgi:DNA-binding transcriptional regulator/RsmH inhibitor MraZ